MLFAGFKNILVDEKKELLKFKEQIFLLFENCFGKEIEEDLWDWAYINNPNGNPIVSLCFDKERLIGHYAFIPVSLIYRKEKIKAALSMTTMVDFNYRRYNIFQLQAEDVNIRALELKYHLVYGFPNKKAAPGLKKRINWVLDENSYVVNLSCDELQKMDTKDCSNTISFDIQNKSNLNWRLNKPGQHYFKKGNNILKEFGRDVDIVFNGGNFSAFEQNKRYNLLLSYEEAKLFKNNKFSYIFGYKLFDSSLNGIEFKKDLIMSDIF